MQLAGSNFQLSVTLLKVESGASNLRNAENSQGVICGKSSAECSTNYPLSLFRIPQVKNSAEDKMRMCGF